MPKNTSKNTVFRSFFAKMGQKVYFFSQNIALKTQFLMIKVLKCATAGTAKSPKRHKPLSILSQ